MKSLNPCASKSFVKKLEEAVGRFDVEAFRELYPSILVEGATNQIYVRTVETTAVA